MRPRQTPWRGNTREKSARQRCRRLYLDILEILERRVLLSASTVPITSTVVDPTDGLRLSVGDEQPSNILGDVAITNSFGNWSIGGGSIVTSGSGMTATGATSGIAVTLSKSGIAAMATPLEYAYYDYVQIDLQLPVGYASPVTFSYGTSTAVPTSQQGFSSTRTFTIPASQVATDGQFHIYRINVGKLVWWEGNLTDFQVSIPTTVAGQTETLKYAEVGDLPNTTLWGMPLTEVQYPGGNLDPTNTVKVLPANIQSAQSKHFIVYWDATDTGANPGNQTNFAVYAHNMLELLEQSQRLYTQVLGFNDVFNWPENQFGNNVRYKLNVTSWYAGYFSGGWWLNVDTSGGQDTTVGGKLYTETPGSPVPHEFGHVTDSQNLHYLAGGHFESHANWYREQWVDWYSSMFAAETLPTSTYDPIANMWSNLHVDNSRLIYNDWRVYTPLQYYATSMGLDVDAVSELWSEGATNQTVFAKLATLLPPGMNIKNVAAQLMSYWPTLDFPVRSDMENAIFIAQNGQTAAEIQANFFYQTTSYLIPDSDDSGYTVPLARAPESYAYMTHVLVPNPGSTSVTVTVSGLPSTDPTADWRYVLEDVSGYGTANATVNTYSPVYTNGSMQTISLASAADVVLLVVVATPGNDVLDLTSFDNTARDTQSATRLQYPYQVFVSGAVPASGTSERIAYPRSTTGGFHLNPDGTTGGWVDSTASVASTVYVAPGAEVLGHAVISGSVHIMDYAVVADTAHVSGNATISGYAVVNGSATISGNARVEDHAMVSSGATIQSNAVIEDFALVPAYVGNRVTVTDNAIVRGEATPTGGTLSGTAIVDYDYTSDFSLSTGVNDNNHPYDEPWVYYNADEQAKPDGLIASYSLNETSGSFLFDEFGALNAQLRGTPTRVSDTTMGGNVLSLNGMNQYALLDRSLGDLNAGTYSFFVNPSSTTANQPVLYFGSSANTFLSLTARDTNGDAHLTISVNGTVQQLASTVAVPLNSWTNVAVTFTGSVATFYINGVAAGSGAMTFRPSQVLTSGAYTSPLSLYLGRDAAGGYFTGKLDDIRFYNVAETAAEVKNEFARSGARVGEFFAATPQAFNGTSTEFESGVRNGKTRTLSAWINPTSSASGYTAIIDSYDERGNGNNRGEGIGLSGGIINVRLDGVGLWSTGIAVTLNAWQQVAVTFTGSLATLYVNGVVKATRSYTAVTATKTYHIGFYQTDDNTPPTQTGFFAGQMYDVRIYNSVVTPSVSQPPPTANNDLFAVPGNVSSSLAVLANDVEPSVVGTLKVSAVSQGSHGTVTIPAGGTGVIYTPAAGYSGSDSFTYTINDGFGDTSTATVNMNVQITLTTIVITPSSGPLANGAHQALTAVGYDQSGQVITPTPTYTWSIVSGSGTLVPGGGTNASANFTAGNNTETVVIKASSGAVSTTASFNVTSALAPTFATLPSATPNPTTVSTLLSVLGSDAAGEAGLTYAWNTVGTPPGPVTFSPASGPNSNGTNGAKNITANFTQAGTYTFQVTATNPSGYSITGTVNVVVSQVVSSVKITPSATSIATDATAQFTATAYDQFGAPLAVQPAFTWSIASGSGAIDSNGLYWAPDAAGSATVRAAVGVLAATALITDSPEELAWYQANASSGTTLADSSGLGETATAAGLFNFGPGVAGNALHLTGGNATLPTGIVSSLNDFTISAWVKLDSLANWARVFDFGTGQTDYMFLTPDAGGTNAVRFAITTGGNAAEQQLNGPAIATGSWTLITVTLAGNTGTLYINGIAYTTNTAMTVHPIALGSTTANYLGKSQFPDPALQGSIDDFRIYGRALSAAEVLRLAKPAVIAVSPNPNPTGGATTVLSAPGRRRHRRRIRPDLHLDAQRHESRSRHVLRQRH